MSKSQRENGDENTTSCCNMFLFLFGFQSVVSEPLWHQTLCLLNTWSSALLVYNVTWKWVDLDLISVFLHLFTEVEGAGMFSTECYFLELGCTSLCIKQGRCAGFLFYLHCPKWKKIKIKQHNKCTAWTRWHIPAAYCRQFFFFLFITWKGSALFLSLQKPSFLKQVGRWGEYRQFVTWIEGMCFAKVWLTALLFFPFFSFVPDILLFLTASAELLWCLEVKWAWHLSAAAQNPPPPLTPTDVYLQAKNSD